MTPPETDAAVADRPPGEPRQKRCVSLASLAVAAIASLAVAATHGEVAL